MSFRCNYVDAVKACSLGVEKGPLISSRSAILEEKRRHLEPPTSARGISTTNVDTEIVAVD